MKLGAGRKGVCGLVLSAVLTGAAAVPLTLGVCGQMAQAAAVLTVGGGTGVYETGGDGSGSVSSEQGPGASTQQGMALAPNVSSAMSTPEFWISRVKGSGQTLLTQEQIRELNEKIVQTAETNVLDLAALPEVFDGRGMADQMAGFSSPEKLYLNGKPVPESYYQGIRDNIRSSEVSQEMPLRYGFVVNHTVMKGYPYSDFLSDSATDAEREATLSGLLPGTILQFPGHEMLYLGEVNGKYYTINDVSSLVSPEDTGDPLTVLRIRSIVVNDLSTKRRNGQTWMEQLTKAIQVSRPR